MPRKTKTREQRATDELLVATRVAERAATKRERLKAEYEQAMTESAEADKLREHAASNPFLPQTSAPRARRPRAAPPLSDQAPTNPTSIQEEAS